MVKSKCKGCFNKKMKCELREKFSTRKRLTCDFEREHQPSESKSNNNIDVNKKSFLLEKQKHDNNSSVSYENHRNVRNGPSNVGKTYYMLKILEKIGNKRPIHIITRSPNQYAITSIEIKSIDKNKGPLVNLDDMLGTRNSSQLDELFARGRHENTDVYYISQSYFGLPRQSFRKISDRIILFKQTLRDVESLYKDIRGYDMRYVEFKELCRQTWSENFTHPSIDMSKNRIEGKYRNFNENKNTYIVCIPGSEAV